MLFWISFLWCRSKKTEEKTIHIQQILYPCDGVSFLMNSVIIDHGAYSDIQINTQRVHVHKTKKSHYRQNITLWKAKLCWGNPTPFRIRRLGVYSLFSINLLFTLSLMPRTFTELAAYKEPWHEAEASVQSVQKPG